MIDFTTLFEKAKSIETLDLMVKRQVRLLRLHFNPEVETYKLVADSYRKRGNGEAASMFRAAHYRLQEIQ
jgi:hypothetical protein